MNFAINMIKLIISLLTSPGMLISFCSVFSNEGRLSNRWIYTYLFCLHFSIVKKMYRSEAEYITQIFEILIDVSSVRTANLCYLENIFCTFCYFPLVLMMLFKGRIDRSDATA